MTTEEIARQINGLAVNAATIVAKCKRNPEKFRDTHAHALGEQFAAESALEHLGNLAEYLTDDIKKVNEERDNQRAYRIAKYGENYDFSAFQIYLMGWVSTDKMILETYC